MTLCRKGIDYTTGSDIRPCNQRKAVVEQFAEDVAGKCGFEVGNDPADLVTDLGGSIHFQDIDDWLDKEAGSIFVHGSVDFDICLPTYTSALRDKFTIAHELAAR